MVGGQNLEVLVTAYLKWCYSHETPPRVEELARFIGVSRATLHRLVVETFATTPSSLLKDSQLAFAKHLIRTTNQTLTSIAYNAGFGTRGSLFRAFREREGTTPGQLRATKLH